MPYSVFSRGNDFHLLDLSTGNDCPISAGDLMFLGCDPSLSLEEGRLSACVGGTWETARATTTVIWELGFRSGFTTAELRDLEDLAYRRSTGREISALCREEAFV